MNKDILNHSNLSYPYKMNESMHQTKMTKIQNARDKMN